MNNLSLNRRIRQTLYVLKRAFGNMVTIYRLLESDTDYKTGIKTQTTVSHVVHRCIILPVKITREVVTTLSSITSNKNYVYGGFYDSDARDFIVDARDLPIGYLIRQNDYIIYGDQRFEIKSVVELEQKTGWILSGRAVVGPATIHVESLETIQVSETTTPGGP